MIFARRALQRRLVELRNVFECDVVDALVARLNAPGRDRLAAMWEVVVLHALAKCGQVRAEIPLTSGRRPDILFDDGVIRFIGDITTISDEGLDAENPYSELSELIEKAKNKLGLPIGGLDLQVKSVRHRSARGVKTVLRLPARKQLQKFVQEQIVPHLRYQIRSGEKVLRIEIDDDSVGFVVTINPAMSPYSSVGFSTYDVPKIKDRNPLYSALKAKAAQLRGAEGITGVIVADGDCATLSNHKINSDGVSVAAIAQEFLRQYSSIDFVLVLTIRGKTLRWPESAELRVYPMIAMQPGLEARDQLSTLFTTMVGQLPNPVVTPVNGARRAREGGYGLGHHGGYTMAGKKLRMGSRELLEILAGTRTLGDSGARNMGASDRGPEDRNHLQMAFLQNLAQGRLPAAITVVKTGEDGSDDWIEFDFGDADPAIAPFS